MQTINWEEEQELVSANRQRRQNAVKWDELKQFVWNSRKLEFMGGDARSWGKASRTTIISLNNTVNPSHPNPLMAILSLYDI
jgi:hypothetical protein